MSKNKKQATIYEIAEQLGVAVSTVSRALHNDPRISQETTEKVKKAAKQMGYTPNSAARSLRTGKSNTIGLIVRDINDEWCAVMVPAIEKNCAKHGMGLLLCNAENKAERENFYIQILRQRRVDGILILTPVHPIQELYLPYSKLIPLVLLDHFSEKPKINAVCVDHVAGAYMSAMHLINLGHRNIGFISGPLNLSSAISYVKGFQKAVKESGLEWNNKYLFTGEQTYSDDGRNAFEYFWQLDPRPTAIASGSDFMAAGAMRAALNQGLQIPEDLSIIGYDNISLSSLVTPPLTTILQDRNKIGEEAMRLLFEEMNSPEGTKTMSLIPPEIIIRGSTSSISN